MSPKKVARPLDIYVRVSDVKGRSGESFISPKEQEDRCRAALASRGLEVGEVFTDLDVSGGTMDRPEFKKIRRRIEDGVSGGIVVARIDRFGRTVARALDAIEEIDEAGGVVITAEGDFDTSTAVGELVLGMMLQLAQFELRRIRESWSAAKRRAVDRGIHIAPRVPPGYVRDPETKLLEPDGKNAETIRDAYTMAARGDSYARIATFFNSRKLPIWSGDGVWQPKRIKRLLANRVYLGEARSGAGHVNPDAHPPLVTEQTWMLAQRRKNDGPALTQKSETLLAGLCRCASCSFAMRSQQARGKTIATYRCTTHSVHDRCPAPVSISLARLEEYVLEQLLERGSLGLRQTQEANELEQELIDAAIEAEHMYRDALTNVELRQRIGAADHDAMIASLHEAWQDAQAKLPEPKKAAGFDTADLAKLVDELQRKGDLQGLRELLGSAIQAVFIRPAASRARNLPIADRVKVVWQDEDRLELPKRGVRFEPRAYTW